ncbi:hypothetical protein CJ030_MR5G025784 [Morella rubra]|uniref:Uncharacterized protein n=1 Tax=Morella rubra TaxID=262757 RepID=A0A6A1VJS9_9ROSI|nr:hypothetical protein CJ030_MR5G025784 [Morella rubra]
MAGNERAGSSRSSTDHSGEPDYFFRNSKCAEKFYNDFSKRKVMLGRKVNVKSLSDFEIARPFMKQGWMNLLDMGNEVFPKYMMRMWMRMAEGEEVDAEAMEFDIVANRGDDPPIIPSPTRVPDLTSSFDTQLTAFEERMTAMHEAQKKFLQESVTSMQEEQRQFFA